jgi:hypothetical protein
MPLGSPSIRPQDRGVIFVGDRKAALAAAARAKAKANDIARAYDSLTLNPMVKLGERAAEAYYAREFQEQSFEALMGILSEALDIGCPVMAFEQRPAMDLFRFGVGHSPRNGSIYVRHPVFDDLYVAPEDFSRALSREKSAAFQQLASALGAKELRLTTATVHTKKGLFGVTVSVPEAATEVGLKVTFDSKGEFIKQVYSRFGTPRARPTVPPDLSQWVEMDPDLRTMARDRTEGHLLEHRITLEFKEGLGIGGEVAAKVAGRGLTAGGSYSAISHSVWNFEAEYWPRDP